MISFDTTPIMSTYLVAIVVGEYDYVEGESEEGIKVRVYTPLGKKEQVQYQSTAKKLKGLRKKNNSSKPYLL